MIVGLDFQIMQDLLQSEFDIGFDEDFSDDEIDHRAENGKDEA